MARFPYLSVRSAAKIRLAVAAPPTRPMRHVRAGIFPEDWKSRLQASSERARNLVGGLRGRNRQAPILAANPPYAAAPWGSDQARSISKLQKIPCGR